MNVIKFLGSLKFTVILSISLMLLLVVSTFSESYYGTTFVQKVFYQARWFDALLSLLWINIFCSTILRLPFQKHHIGFLITHIGILGLLLGALLTRLGGIEGQIALYEKESSHQIRQSGFDLNIILPDQKKITLDVKAAQKPLPIGSDGSTISLGDILENALKEVQVSEGSAGSPSNRALFIEMKSPTVSLDRSFWLIEKDSQNPQSQTEAIGPVKIVLSGQVPASQAPKSPALIVFSQTGKELSTIKIKGPQKDEYPIDGTDLKIRSLKYYPFAKVDGHQLVNVPGSSYNPAVEFDVIDPKGESAHFVKFALYPEFESMHGKSSQKPFDIEIKFEAGQNEGSDFGAAVLVIYPHTKDLWKFRSILKDGSSQEGDIKQNEWLPAGWMDISFRVVKVLERAQVSYQPVKTTNIKKGVFAAEIILTEGKAQQSRWLSENEEMQFPLKSGILKVGLTPKMRTVPFLLTLNDFRKIDYPGTNSPASFESDVTLEDYNKKVKITQTISMNKPMDYDGYRIFQSSYVQDPSSGEASIFTVSKNPGIGFIYFSSIAIFLGAFLQFYVKGFSKGSKPSST